MSARLTQTDLDRHIADKEEPFYSPRLKPTSTRDLVWTRTGVGIGSAHVPAPKPMSDEAIRVQGLLLARTPRSEQRTAADVWRDAEAAAAGDAHVRAMAETPARRSAERRHRIVDTVLLVLFFGLLLAAWSNWLPGGAR